MSICSANSLQQGRVRYPVARASDGSVKHIREVASGDQGYECPTCHHKLIAYKGIHNAHHFHHDVGSHCDYGLETLLHHWAKQCLPDPGRLGVPELVAHLGSRSQVVQEKTNVEYDCVRVENRLGGIIPDIVVRAMTGALIVEIAVTHRVDAAKLEKLEGLGLGAIEIDLSGYDLSREPAALLRLIQFEAPRVCLFYPRLADAEMALQQAKVDEKRRWREAKKREREPSVSRLQAKYAELCASLPPEILELKSADDREAYLDDAARAHWGRDTDWTIEVHTLLSWHTPRSQARSSALGLARALRALNAQRRRYSTR